MVGSILLTLIAVGYLIYAWWQGGVVRALAQYVLLAIGSLFLVNWIALVIFFQWQNLHLPAYPWTTVVLFTTLPKHSLAFQHLMLCLMLTGFIINLLLLARLFSAQSKAEKVFGHAHFANVWELQKAKLFSEQGIILGKAHGKILRLSGFESVLMTAPTGSGKTTSIAIPNLLEWQGSAVINDIKGELHHLTANYRKNPLKNACYRFSPTDPEFITHGYNPFFYVSDNPNLRIRDLQLIAEILIPSERVDGGFWYTSSRDIFIMLALYLLETQQTATLAEIHDLSKQEDFFDWLNLILVKKTITQPVFIQNAASLLNADPEKTQKNILKDFHARMTLFADPLVRHATSKNDFDLRKLRQEKMSIYLTIPDADKTRLKPLLTLFWAQLIHLMTQAEPDIKKEPYPLLALLDEFGNLAKIDKLKEGMSFLRSYRMRAIVIVQYLSQIYATYGQHDAKGFLNTKAKIAFALNDIDDAKFFSQSLGQKTVKVKSSGSSYGQHDSRSQNISFQSRALMTPDEMLQLPADQAIVLLESKPPIKAKKCYWFKEKRYRRLLKPEKK